VLAAHSARPGQPRPSSASHPRGSISSVQTNPTAERAYRRYKGALVSAETLTQGHSPLSRSEPPAAPAPAVTGASRLGLAVATGKPGTSLRFTSGSVLCRACGVRKGRWPSCGFSPARALARWWARHRRAASLEGPLIRVPATQWRWRLGSSFPFGDDASAGGAPAPLFFPARRRATAGGGDWRREDHLDTAGPFL